MAECKRLWYLAATVDCTGCGGREGLIVDSRDGRSYACGWTFDECGERMAWWCDGPDCAEDERCSHVVTLALLA